MGEKLLRPAWVEVNMTHLEENYKGIRGLLGQRTKFCAIVKADAYGHGAVEVARALSEYGAEYLGVATLSEGIHLRENGIRLPILILGYTEPIHWQQVIDYDLIQTVISLEQAREIQTRAADYGKRMKVHLKVDTGVSRLGFLEGKPGVIEEMLQVCAIPQLEIDGVFTHFALADQKDKAYTYDQFQRFMNLVQALEARGATLGIKHVCNSAATIDLPEMHLDMVRVGIALYGLPPSQEVNLDRVKLKPVMALKAKIVHVKELPPNRGISYGHTYKTQGTRTIITIPVGYADGYSRGLSNRGHVLLHQQEIPLVGTICMDQMMADVTGTSPKVGDEIVLMSNDPNSQLTATHLADLMGTINYEVVCLLGKRLPKVYLENNTLLQVRDSLVE